MKGSNRFSGAVFDLDGVITRTAKIHFQAWKEIFDDFLNQRQGGDFTPFRYTEDYLPNVDGRSRYQGVKQFLSSRDLELPFGEPEDAPGEATVCALGNLKNRRFRELVAGGKVEIVQSALKLIDRLQAAGGKIAVASSSRNCSYILEQAGIADRFDTVVDGNLVADLELSGKPAPDIFELAAERLGLPAVECLLIEDATAGVEAGSRGNFGLVAGIADEADTERMLYRGADIVVTGLEELTYERILDWFEHGLEEESWNLTYYGFRPGDERLREALTTVGNGYFGTRGSLESEDIDDNSHNPGTYLAGLFNRAGTEVGDRTIYNTDFVNCPNWTKVTVHVAGGERLSPHTCEVVEYRHRLDLRRGVMSHDVTYKDKKGRLTRIRTRRFASMKLMHLAGISTEVTPINHSEEISIRTELDGNVENYLVERYRELTRRHLQTLVTEQRGGRSLLQTETLNSSIRISFASHTVLRDSTEAPRIETGENMVREVFSRETTKGEPLVIDRLVAIFTDREDDRPSDAALRTLDECGSYSEEEENHARRWEELWNEADLVIDGDRFAQAAVRLHIYHLLTTASPNNTELDAGLPARGLHGEAYRGHIFWDEMFILPFYTTHFPDVAKSHLMYRYRRLDAARELAQSEGYKGAMYPWQSAASGGPESQELHYNPRSGEWDPDLSRLQRHISISIAYDVYTYFYTSNDSEFLHRFGMEMLLEIGRFWASIAKLDKGDGRYHIEGVMGPDEFHEKYPDAPKDEGGFRDNAYTNIMAAWLLHKIEETCTHLPDEVRKRLFAKIDFGENELEEWRNIVRGLTVVFHDELLISQFDGYMDLEELDWEKYRNKYENIRRMDRVLKAEGNDPDRYKVAKQADVLMVFYLLSPQQVEDILALMGYPGKNGEELLRRNYEYYVKRTSHGSTLSWIVHSTILSHIDEHKDDQWRWFVECLESDIYDTQGGTTLEGIHCGVMAASLDIVISGYCGLKIFRDHLEASPALPDGWRRVEFQVRVQEGRFKFEIERVEEETRVYVTRRGHGGESIGVTAHGETDKLPGNERRRIL